MQQAGRVSDKLHSFIGELVEYDNTKKISRTAILGQRII
jgi:ABC-type phosphate transport system ATPase subunit